MVIFDCRDVREVPAAFGQKGVSREQVGSADVAQEGGAVQARNAALGTHITDQ